MRAFFKLSVLFVAIFLFSVVGNAQEDNVAVVGVRAGMNFSGQAGTPTDTKVGFNIGITVDFRLSDEIYLITALEYTVKGSKGYGFIPAGTDSWGQYYPDHYYGANEKPAYLQLPLHVGYLWSINRDFRLMFHAGPYIAYGLGGKNDRKLVYEDHTDRESIDYFGPGISKFDWGLGAGINAEYDRYVLGVGYDRGLRNFAPNYNDGKARTRNIYITLGYLF